MTAPTLLFKMEINSLHVLAASTCKLISIWLLAHHTTRTSNKSTLLHVDKDKIEEVPGVHLHLRQEGEVVLSRDPKSGKLIILTWLLTASACTSAKHSHSMVVNGHTMLAQIFSALLTRTDQDLTTRKDTTASWFSDNQDALNRLTNL